ARPSAGCLAVPAKMTSSIFWLRTLLGACAPRTQAMASTTFDLPLPFGPTTTVTPGSSRSAVVSAKDLKPLRVNWRRNTAVHEPTRPDFRGRGGSDGLSGSPTLRLSSRPVQRGSDGPQAGPDPTTSVRRQPAGGRSVL